MYVMTNFMLSLCLYIIVTKNAEFEEEDSQKYTYDQPTANNKLCTLKIIILCKYTSESAIYNDRAPESVSRSYTIYLAVSQESKPIKNNSIIKSVLSQINQSLLNKRIYIHVSISWYFVF